MFAIETKLEIGIDVAAPTEEFRRAIWAKDKEFFLILSRFIMTLPSIVSNVNAIDPNLIEFADERPTIFDGSYQSLQQKYKSVGIIAELKPIAALTGEYLFTVDINDAHEAHIQSKFPNAILREVLETSEGTEIFDTLNTWLELDGFIEKLSIYQF